MRGIGGIPSKYDLSYDAEGNMVVIEIESGERLKVTKAKSKKAGTPQRWGIRDKKNRMNYFQDKDVVTCELRKRLSEIPKERIDIRNNVEATIFQVGYHYRGGKSRYRGLMKHRMWSISRCLWVNFRRIQLWCIRQMGKSAKDIPKGILALNFLQKFLQGFPLIFWSPVEADCY